jgi:hypothetical protein
MSICHLKFYTTVYTPVDIYTILVAKLKREYISPHFTMVLIHAAQFVPFPKLQGLTKIFRPVLYKFLSKIVFEQISKAISKAFITFYSST